MHVDRNTSPPPRNKWYNNIPGTQEECRANVLHRGRTMSMMTDVIDEDPRGSWLQSMAGFLMRVHPGTQVIKADDSYGISPSSRVPHLSRSTGTTKRDAAT